MTVAALTKFHLSLNVSDLNRSVAFYRTLFSCEPAKQRADYAKFELDEPPVVLSLEPHVSAGPGTLNHLGLRLADSASLVEMQRRLELAGLPSQREEGVECCYARQTKFWLHDPDGNLWEFYVLEGDITHRGAGQQEVGSAVRTEIKVGATIGGSYSRPYTTPVPEPTEWEHRLGEAFPQRLPFEDNTLREVRLRGTFNTPAVDAETALAEVHRVLDTGGQLLIHCLTADSPVTQELSLPGPAAMVKHVPTDRELAGALELAGFAGMELTKFGESPCFHFGGAQMRETMLRAIKPASQQEPDTHEVVYRGPFREVIDDFGRTWRRGERQQVPASVWSMLKQQAFAPHFTCLAVATEKPMRCST